MKIKVFEKLPHEAKQIRTAVFIEEQKFKEEFDKTDDFSRHLVAFDDSTPVATCRYYVNGEGEYVIGRLAVVKEFRGRNIGSLVLKATEEEIIKEGGNKALLHSQCTAEKFYAKNGYKVCSEPDFDEDCPHVWMCKKLSK